MGKKKHPKNPDAFNSTAIFDFQGLRLYVWLYTCQLRGGHTIHLGILHDVQHRPCVGCRAVGRGGANNTPDDKQHLGAWWLPARSYALVDSADLDNQPLPPWLPTTTYADHKSHRWSGDMCTGNHNPYFSNY